MDRVLALLCLLLLVRAAAAAEVEEYNARVWQSDAGLPLDAVRSVAQTPDGFLWVGTQAGLARFDGINFTLFDSKNVPAMTSANISGLATAKDGSLWICTGQGGVLRLRNGQFTHYGPAEGLAGNVCLGSLLEGPPGTMWIGMRDGLSRYSNGRFTTIYTNIVRAMCFDAFNNLWCATATGLDHWSNGVVVEHWGKTNGLADPNVRAICCSRDGTIWIGVGAEVRRVIKGKIRTSVQQDGPGENLVTFLHQDRRGVFWVGTYDGLARMTNGKLVPELSVDGLPYGSIMDFLEDRENNLWVCAKDGLVRLKPNRVLSYTLRQGLRNENISSVLQDQTGAICIGTWGGGLNRLKNGVITTFTNRQPYPLLVLGMHQDHAGGLWVGTDFNEGLFQLDGSHVSHLNDANGANIPAIRVIYEDRSTNLWVGTSQGLYRMESSNVFTLITGHGLEKDNVRTILQDHAGVFWFGTQAGLVRKEGGLYTRIDKHNGLPEDLVLSIFQDSRNILWVTVRGGGLLRLDHGAWRQYTTRDGLFSDNVYSILEADGWFWMGSDRGIFRVSRKDLDNFDRGLLSGLRSISYGKTDGMANKMCSSVAQPSACKSKDGRLWFATVKGLCMIDPKKNTLREAAPPPVVIESLVTEQGTFFEPQNLPAPIRLTAGRGELEFRFAALGYRAPEMNRYRYRLDGVDADWVDAVTTHLAHYNNIYPGHYLFHVLACNSDGVWNETGASLAVVMPPHFWQTWWFRLALILLALMALAMAGKIFQMRRLEIERLRVRIAADLHDEIGSNLASIALLSQLGQKNPAQPAPELSEINRIALFTVNGIREIVWFINPEYDAMPELVSRLRSVAEQMLAGLTHTFDSSGVVGGGKLSPEFRRHLSMIFKEILHNVAEHSRATEVAIILSESRGLMLLRVTDNGGGFDPAAVVRGNGLKNIRLRVRQLDGTVQIGPGPTRGTAISVTVKVA